MKLAVVFPVDAKPLPADVAAIYHRMRRMEWIARTQAQIAGLDFDLDGFMQGVIDRFPEMTPAEGVVVELVDGDQMVYRAASAHLAQFLGMRIDRAGSLAGLCVEQARTLYAADTEEDPRVDREASRQIGLRSMVCAPLIAGAQVIGVLKAVSALPNRFGDEDLETLDLLAKTIASALSKQLDYDALRAQTELFESSFRHAPIGKALVGLDGRFLKVNDAFGAIVGYTADQMLTVTFQDITHPDDLDRDLELLAELRAGLRTTYQMDKRYRRRDGSLVWAALSVSVVRDPAGAPDYYIAQVEDLTTRMDQEAALVSAKAEAEAATVVKSQFLANMSHEIRTPMTAVIGFSSLLLERDDLHEEARLYGERINFAGRTLLALVNDILDFSKLEAGETVLHPKTTDVRAIAEQTLALFLPQAEAKGLRLDFDARDVGRPVVTIDPQAFGQVLTNLIGNAIKFTDAGEVKVRLVQADDRLHVTVRDSGPGLDEQQQSLLFKRFSQVDGSTTRRHGGTGLGLAISKALVEIMGGEIGVRSQPGEGCAFHFEVPAPRLITRWRRAKPASRCCSTSVCWSWMTTATTASSHRPSWKPPAPRRPRRRTAFRP